jgi:hypothetical protein
MKSIKPPFLIIAAALSLLALRAEEDPVPLSRLPIPLELMPPDTGETDDITATNQPTENNDRISETNRPTSVQSAPPAILENRDRGELSLQRQEILSAREELRSAFRANPGDAPLRARYAWFLYSNGFHDRECLSLLEESLRNGSAADPAGVFNAIVEVRHELRLPSTALRNPEPSQPKRKHISKTPPSPSAVRKRSDGKTVAEPVSEERFRHWIFTPYYSYSSFNHAASHGRRNMPRFSTG